MDHPSRNARQLEAFVHAAVRLPHSRLRTIDLEWESLHVHRRVVTELVQASKAAQVKVEQLRDYVTKLAREAVAAGESPGPLIPEDIAEAVFPAARAVLLREVLETPGNEQRARAFAALTEPFKDILPRSPHHGERRGDR